MKQFIHAPHGTGGKSFHKLMKQTILPILDNPFLRPLNDGAILGRVEGKLVMTTDSHVVFPRIFPGGNLGSLAFCGTINDLAVMGAKPLYLTLSMIIEEGFSIVELTIHLKTIAEYSQKHNVPIVSGDTKVVEHGKGDGLFLNTTGLGVIETGQQCGNEIKAGDQIILTGTVGDHGIAVLSQRESLRFESDLISDVAPLDQLLLPLWKEFSEIRCMRDPTRGGVSTILNEIANDIGLDIEISEENIPVKAAVRSACELLGFDPLQIANEGKAIIIVSKNSSEKLLARIKEQPLGEDAQIIGEILDSKDGLLRLRTAFGSTRILPWPDTEQMPRIC